ncbi:DUF6059 family protein [Streptomyces sp. NBC_01618]|uniref:DUF6059 family protein n=1 Tax=Streptomyces sp. NBC_01618 TaxID=2975900 RepID=UPI0038656419|nr:hypothetical protein OH735_03750 [Streptomyces sp. NBC_01618]
MSRWGQFFTVRRLVGSLLRPVGRALVQAGAMWVIVPSVDPGPVRGADPPPSHPERLRPDVPLTEAERALQEQLQDLDRLLPGDQL